MLREKAFSSAFESNVTLRSNSLNLNPLILTGSHNQFDFRPFKIEWEG